MYPDSSIFRTAEGESKDRDAYDAVLDLWSLPYESMHIPTRFGTTHIIASGSKDTPPLVLLHRDLFKHSNSA